MTSQVDRRFPEPHVVVWGPRKPNNAQIHALLARPADSWTVHFVLKLRSKSMAPCEFSRQNGSGENDILELGLF